MSEEHWPWDMGSNLVGKWAEDVVDDCNKETADKRMGIYSGSDILLINQKGKCSDFTDAILRVLFSSSSVYLLTLWYLWYKILELQISKWNLSAVILNYCMYK